MQLRLWSLPTVDLTRKIMEERLAGVVISYHFCGRPLTMHKPVSADRPA